MKQILVAAVLVAIVVLFTAPSQSFAAGDTLVVYATPISKTLDMVIRGDTLSNGKKAHHWYKLVSTDTTYTFDATITTSENIWVVGVPNPTTGKLPCIQPDVLPDFSVPGVFFTLSGQGTKATFQNLYLLGIAINNTVNYGAGQAFQVSADSIRFAANNVVFEQWSQFAIGYSGNWDKFFITNCKFRNMTTQPSQWYVGEVLRNENYLGKFPTDSVVMRYNTMLCVSGYASCPVTVMIVKYFDFSHNNVIYTFKNPFFIFNVTNAKLDNNIFYANYAGGISAHQEYPWWDQLWSPEIGSVIDLDRLDLSKDSVFAPEYVGNAKLDSLAERKRNVEVKNNAYFWPKALTDFWTAWDDTAHADSIYTATWMNARTTNMFNDKTRWPGFVQSGNLNVDPGFGTSIPDVLNAGAGNANGVGLLNWFRAVRTGTGTTETYGYKITQVGSNVGWTPPWPLPETNDMKYTNSALKTGATDGGPIGDPNWFGIVVDVKSEPTAVPQGFALSAAYPNPFNPSTNLQYTLNKAGMVTLKVYNILGQVVSTIVNETKNSGVYTVRVDMAQMGSGVYFAVLEQGTNRAVQKMMLLK
jgi:hypothetical protein